MQRQCHKLSSKSIHTPKLTRPLSHCSLRRLSLRPSVRRSGALLTLVGSSAAIDICKMRRNCRNSLTQVLSATPAPSAITFAKRWHPPIRCSSPMQFWDIRSEGCSLALLRGRHCACLHIHGPMRHPVGGAEVFVATRWPRGPRCSRHSCSPRWCPVASPRGRRDFPQLRSGRNSLGRRRRRRPQTGAGSHLLELSHRRS